MPQTPRLSILTSETYVGEIRIFAGNFAPVNWAFCHGQLLSITKEKELFVLLRTKYGGDGFQTFALPDLRGRLPMHQGSGEGLTPRIIGEQVGEEEVVLATNNLPAHNHPMLASLNPPATRSPEGSVLSKKTGTDIYDSGTASKKIKLFPETAVGETGGNKPHDNMMPYLGLNFIIALKGVSPSRNPAGGIA